VEAIGLVEGDKYNTEESILITTEKKSFSALDKRFLRQLVNGVVKMKRRLDHDIRFYLSRPSEKLPYQLRNILRLGYFQLFFTDRIPAAAAVSEAVNLAHHFSDAPRARMVNAVLRSALRHPERVIFRDKDKDPVCYLADYYSYPEWFVKYCLDEFRPSETEKLLETMNRPPMLSFRINRLKTEALKVLAALQEAEIKYSRGKYLDDFYHLEEGGLSPEDKLIKEGLIYIQDESAGMTVHLMDLQENLKVLDMAAAPGGKTAYAAQLMNNTGLITAIDKSRPRLEVLVKNGRRLGVQNIVPVLADGMEFQGGPFDRVLLDVPCSGWGNAGRHSDLRWAKEKIDINRLFRLQSMMIDRAARLVKPDGLLVYSTCTIIRQENDQVVEEFLLRNGEFELIPAGRTFRGKVVSERGFLKTYPNRDKLTGAFAAVLRRKKGVKAKARKKKR
jgi:16S rRNA (cytosine967-C5)-methyltransferase